MAHRPPFDPQKPLVAATDFIFAGDAYRKGDPFPKPGTPKGQFPTRLFRRQYEAHKVNHPVDEQADGDVRMAGPKGGRYTITAPWLDEPVVARGKVLAEQRFDEIVAAGPPLGWIEGGSRVTVADGEGGWYTVDAPWLEAPERVQGRAAAEARQRELHDREPATYRGVTLEPVEGGFQVRADWLEETETFSVELLARERADELRAEGPPPASETGDDKQRGGLLGRLGIRGRMAADRNATNPESGEPPADGQAGQTGAVDPEGDGEANGARSGGDPVAD